MAKKTFIIHILMLLVGMPMTAQTKSGLSPEAFVADINGKQTALYTITNLNGMEACITNFGARLVSLMAPGKRGNGGCGLGFRQHQRLHIAEAELRSHRGPIYRTDKRSSLRTRRQGTPDCRALARATSRTAASPALPMWYGT